MPDHDTIDISQFFDPEVLEALSPAYSTDKVEVLVTDGVLITGLVTAPGIEVRGFQDGQIAIFDGTAFVSAQTVGMSKTEIQRTVNFAQRQLDLAAKWRAKQ